jgi:putative SOS response-associated peptidase YedK
MCGRYLVITEDEILEMRAILDELSKRFMEEPPLLSSHSDVRRDSGEVFPGSVTPVLVLEQDCAILKPMRWGFRKWDDKGLVINARAETASSKPMFSKPLQENRCIIPSRGFFEWKHDTNKLTDIELLAAQMWPPQSDRSDGPEKFRIKTSGSQLFCMTGIYRIYEGVEEFAILTMPSMEQMAIIHDRMPVFAAGAQITGWLDHSNDLDSLFANRESGIALDLIRV